MKTIKYSLVFLGLILIGSFIYGKFFFDLDDYKGDIRNMEVQRLGFEKAGYSAYRERSI